MLSANRFTLECSPEGTVPTYQYRCTECGEDLEVVQKFSDEPLTVCPACQGSLRKVFSPVGIVFKGSGFYRTDSRKGSGSGDGAKKDKEPAGAKSADSSAADSGKSDSGKSAANGSSTSAGSDSSSGSSGSSSSGSSSSGKSEKSSSSTTPAASKAG
jgi:putative FmdB family regulatory protein